MKYFLSLLLSGLLLSFGIAHAQCAPFQVCADGWTNLVPSADSRIVYVSSSLGNDANSGLSENAPKQTIAAGLSLLRDGYPDWLRLRSGDTWRESLTFRKSGRSAAERLVITSYGNGPRPLLLNTNADGIHANSYESGFHRRYIVISDLHLKADTNDGRMNIAGMAFLARWQDVLIENVLVERYRQGLVFQATDEEDMRNIHIRRSVLMDMLVVDNNGSNGIFMAGVKNALIEENVIDRNGFAPGTCTVFSGGGCPHKVLNFNNGMYLQYSNLNVTTRGNIVARNGLVGIMQRSGGVSEGNLLLQNPFGMTFGESGLPLSPETMRVHDNIVLEGRDTFGILDYGTGAWGRIPFGVGISLKHRNIDVAGNIIAHQRHGTGNLSAIHFKSPYQDISTQGNIVYDWHAAGVAYGVAVSLEGTTPGGVSIVNNDFQQVHGGGFYAANGGMTIPNAAVSQTGNRYYSPNVSYQGEPGATNQVLPYRDPQRDIAKYMAQLAAQGLTIAAPSLEGFLAEARLQSRQNWRSAFAAKAVREYIKAGFEVCSNSSCTSAPIQHSIQASAASGGAISPSGTVTVNAGAEQQFTMTANPNYRLADVIVNGTSRCGATCPSTYTFTNVQQNSTIEARFTALTMCEIADANGDGTLSDADFTAFSDLFSQGDMRADLNKNNTLEVSDLTIFLQYYSACLPPPPASSPPAAPSALMGQPLGSAAATLQWSDNSLDESGFLVERSLSQTSGFVQVGSTGANEAAFVDSSLKPNTVYYFRVRAVNQHGASGYSNTVKVKTLKKGARSSLVSLSYTDSEQEVSKSKSKAKKIKKAKKVKKVKRSRKTKR